MPIPTHLSSLILCQTLQDSGDRNDKIQPLPSDSQPSKMTEVIRGDYKRMEKDFFVPPGISCEKKLKFPGNRYDLYLGRVSRSEPKEGEKLGGLSRENSLSQGVSKAAPLFLCILKIWNDALYLVQ